MRVVLIGATGLVGRLLVRQLLSAAVPHEVHAIGRRSCGVVHPRLHDHVAQPQRWPEIVGAVEAEVAASTLGTTWRAAGSEDAFRAVDLGLVSDFAEAARRAGAGRMLAVSAVGADAGSRAFYLRVKGEMEAALERIGFGRLDVLRPGLLRGSRGS